MEVSSPEGSAEPSEDRQRLVSGQAASDGAALQAKNVTRSGQREGNKRMKYTATACQDCKRRKVKCSGEDVCYHCRIRKVPCVYSVAHPAEKQQDRAWNVDNDVSKSSAVITEPSKIHTGTEWTAMSTSNTNYTLTPATQRDSMGLEDVELRDRVRALERMVSHMAESAKIHQRFNDRCRVVDPSPPTFQSGTFAHSDDEDDEDSMFAARESGPDDLSLSSQVAAMSAFVSEKGSPNSSGGKWNSKFQVFVEFPEPAILQHLLDVYFRDFDCYFPFLDRQETESRIHSVIRRLGYSSYNKILLVTSKDLSLIALTCVMLAMAECLDTAKGASDASSRPGWPMYLQGCRAAQRFAYSRDIDLDMVRAQSIIAAYLMHAELLRQASQAVSVAFQLATAIKLNDQNAWPTQNPGDFASRQLLWWTIYFLDRRIAQKSSLTYHIRDTDFYVEDFHPKRRHQDRVTTTSSALLPPSTTNYLQALISLARLWGQIWDKFFAAGATKRDDRLEIEIMDTQILNAVRQLPEELRWNVNSINDYTLTEDSEPNLRRRIQIYTRFNLLRMVIRHNPMHQGDFDSETAHLCANLSRDTINTLDIFTTHYPEARATGYFTSVSLVECVYHLSPTLNHSTNIEEHDASVASLKQAYNVLILLSAKLNVSKRALRALNGIMLKWGRESRMHSNGNRTHAEDTRRMYQALSTEATRTEQSHSDSATDQGHIGQGAWMDLSNETGVGRDLEYNSLLTYERATPPWDVMLLGTEVDDTFAH